MVAVARTSTSGTSGTTHVLGVHGGLADTNALVETFGIVPGQFENNIRRINRVYRKAVLTGKDINELDSDCMPPWCRRPGQEPRDLRVLRNGKDCQGPRRARDRQLQLGRRAALEEHDVMKDGELPNRRHDVQGLREGPRGAGEKFACVKLEARHGRMYRTILRAPRRWTGAWSTPHTLKCKNTLTLNNMHFGRSDTFFKRSDARRWCNPRQQYKSAELVDAKANGTKSNVTKSNTYSH